jgi:hypothetical protein
MNLEVRCYRCGTVFERELDLPDGVEPPSLLNCFECRECCANRSVLDGPQEIQKLLEGKTFLQRWEIYKFLAWVRGHSEGYFVDYPDGTFGYVNGYKTYRKENVRITAALWRQSNKKRASEYKRLYRGGYRARDPKNIKSE